MKKRWSNIILHPILFSIFPIAALLAYNIHEVDASSALRFFGLSIVLGFIVWGLIWLVVRDGHKSALMATVLLIIFYSYGHVQDSIDFPVRIFGAPLRNHRNLLTIALVIVGVSFWLILKRIENASTASKILNVVTIILLINPIYQIGSNQITELKLRRNEVEFQTIDSVDREDLPDIYLFILDSYPSADFIADVFEYDNTPFINALEEMGFYVADCSRSNYTHTSSSVTSMLNMEYMDTLISQEESKDPEFVEYKLDNNAVRFQLENLGYKLVSFKTHFRFLTLGEDDVFIIPDPNVADYLPSELEQAQGSQLLTSIKLNDFEWFFVQTTALRIMTDTIVKNMGQADPDQRAIEVFQKYREIKFILSELQTIQEIEGPKFAFVHIALPHEPFVFQKDGSLIVPQTAKTPAFQDQIYYLNEQFLPILERIISESEIPPVIILMGDHGMPTDQTNGNAADILNAYYLPNGGDELLYPTISPINSFRVIFSYYFGAEYPLLEDRYAHPFVGSQCAELYP